MHPGPVFREEISHTGCPKSLAPQAIIYLNADITTNAHIVDLGLYGSCEYTEYKNV